MSTELTTIFACDWCRREHVIRQGTEPITDRRVRHLYGTIPDDMLELIHPEIVRERLIRRLTGIGHVNWRPDYRAHADV